MTTTNSQTAVPTTTSPAVDKNDDCPCKAKARARRRMFIGITIAVIGVAAIGYFIYKRRTKLA